MSGPTAELKISEFFIETGLASAKGNSNFANAMRDSPVGNSSDFERIKSLPRRRLIIADDHVVIESFDGTKKRIPDLTRYFAKNPQKPTLKLWPLQNAALWEMYYADGLYAPIAVGGGKTLISLLAPRAMGSQRAVILVKPQLRDQLFTRDMPFYGQHFEIPWDVIKVVAYSELSSQKNSDILERIRPDLIIADEAQSLRPAGGASSARARRFRRYMKAFPETRFVALSGTMARRSIKDFSSLIHYALKKNAPMPRDFGVLEEWAMALDVPRGDVEQKEPGVLTFFCKDGESPRKGFQRRISETPGVVSSVEASIDIPLCVNGLRPPIPEKVKEALHNLYEDWKLGDEVFADHLQLASAARQLSAGFWYEWQWPNGVKDVEWILKRRAWYRTVRQFLHATNRANMDSEALVVQAVVNDRVKGEWGKKLKETYFPWIEVKDRTSPQTVARWVDPFLITDAVKWGRDTIRAGRTGIIFFEHQAVGDALRSFGHWPVFGQGEDAGILAHASKDPVICCTIGSQSVGKNLQSWSNMLIMTPPSMGAAWEQMIGRVRRPGQVADKILVDVYVHTDVYHRALDSAFADAEFIDEVQGTPQMLLAANVTNFIRDQESAAESEVDDE